ncbi:hypothetical protein Pmani_007138 [Petrolisthes manimaculis]|uniref:PHD-type domain-containing protein n=1 Tax=Petrolisthes manimaculis TaxID=1843537 RepID=A0AAE1UKF3_9EUCA|nr:hypothetical protein Pmani_007138 [Petrolisthes manimaculis]
MNRKSVYNMRNKKENANMGEYGRDKVVQDGAKDVNKPPDGASNVILPTSSSSSKETVRSDNCVICEKTVKNDDQAIQCEICRLWVHITCEGMPKEAYDYIMSVGDQVAWKCTYCKRGCLKLYEYMEELGKQNKTLWSKQREIRDEMNALTEVVGKNQEINKDMEVRLGALEANSVVERERQDNNGEKCIHIETRLANLEANFAGIEEKLALGSGTGDSSQAEITRNEAVPDLKAIMKQEMEQLKKTMVENDIQLKKEVKEKQEEKLRELRDEEARRNNIIIYGIPESQEKEGPKRRDSDQEVVVKLFQEVLEVKLNQTSLVKIIRLGKREESVAKPRPLLVGLDSPILKRDVLLQTKKLKGKDEYKDIFLQHDLTKGQRENMKSLAAEARKMELEDKSGNFLYRIRGPPENMIIKKIWKQM